MSVQGQGVQDIYSYWQSRNFNSPLLESEIDYTKLTLTFQSGMIADFEKNLPLALAKISLSYSLFKKIATLYRLQSGKAMFAELTQKTV